VRDAAIVNLDMRGFTLLAARETPDEVIRVLGEYQARMVPVLQKHGGSIDKFLGDGILATFGAAFPSQSPAADALKALEEAVEEARIWREDCLAKGRPCPEVNGAVASGPTLFGAVGNESRLEFTVIGDAVNLSAKLEKQNKVLGVRAICDQTTFDQARDQGYAPAEEKRQVTGATIEGVGHPVDLMVLAE
jgi:adenylate cyclase